MKKKILIGLGIFFIVLLIGGYIFARTSFFMDNIARSLAESMLEKNLGRGVSVKSITGNLFSGVNISGLTIAKGEEISSEKFLEVEEVTLNYSILSLLRWRFVVNSIRVIQPRIRLERDEEGKLDLPESIYKSITEKKKEGGFSVLVSNLEILSGETEFIDRKNSMHLMVSGIDGSIVGGGAGGKEYSGKLGIEKVEIDLPGVSKTIRDLSLFFETSESGVSLSDFQLQIGRSHLQAKSEITLAEPPEVDAEIQSTLFLEDVADLVPQLDQLDGEADIYAEVKGNISDLSGLCRINLPILHVNNLEARNLKAEARFTQDEINLTDLSMDLSDRMGSRTYGQTSNLSVKGSAQISDGKLSNYNGIVNLNHLDLDGILTELSGSNSPISGDLSGEISINGAGLSLDGIKADARLSMIDTVYLMETWKPEGQEAGNREIDIGTVEASLFMEGRSIALNASRKKTKAGLKGKLLDDGQIELSMDVDRIDLEEMTSLLHVSPYILGDCHISADASMTISDPGFRAFMGLPPVDSPSRLVEGITDLRAQVDLAIPDLSLQAFLPKKADQKIEGEYPIKDIVDKKKPNAEPIKLGSLTGSLNLVDDRLQVEKVGLQLGKSKAIVQADVNLNTLMIDSVLQIDSFKLEDYKGLLDGAELPIYGGVVNGQLNVKGKPTDISGRGQLSVADLSVGDRNIDPILVPLEIESNVLKIPDLVISSLGEQVSIACELNPLGDYSVKVDSSPIDLSKFSTDDLPISGTAQISLSGEGNIESPLLEGKLVMRSLGYNGENFGDGECTFGLKDDKAYMDVSLSQRSLIAALDASIQYPFPFNGIIQLGNLDLEPALKLAGISEMADLRVAGNIDLMGEGAYLMNSSVDVTMQNVILDISGLRWTNDLPVKFQFNDSKLTIDSLKMKSPGGQFLAKGQVDVTGNMDIAVIANSVNLAVLSSTLELPKTVGGTMDYTMKVDGNINSPLLDIDLNISGLTYEQLTVDDVSSRISYKEGLLEVKELLLKAFGGETMIKVLFPLDLDLRNLPTPDQLMEEAIYASVDSKDLDLSFIPQFAHQVVSSSGELDDIHFEAFGTLMHPKIGGSLEIKDARFQLESLPAPVENLNGRLVVQASHFPGMSELPSPENGTEQGTGEKAQEDQKTGKRENGKGSEQAKADQRVDHEVSLNLAWKIEEGEYNAQGSIQIPYWVIDSIISPSNERAARSTDIAVSSNGEPDFQFDLDVKNGQLGSLVKEIMKDQISPFTSNFSGRMHLDGFLGRASSLPRSPAPLPQSSLASTPQRSSAPSPLFPVTFTGLPFTIEDLRANVTLDSFNLSANGHEVKNDGQASISFADQKLEISNLRFMTSSPVIASSPQMGYISISGEASLDRAFKLEVLAEHLHPGLLTIYNPLSSSALSGNLDFDVIAEGRLESPEFSVFLTAKALSIPISTSSEQTKIDTLLCNASYSDDSLNIERVRVESYGNSLDASGNLPVRLSLMPVSVEPLDQQMELKMVMHNFDLAFLSHLAEEIGEIKGNVEADVRVSGSPIDPHLDGNFQLSNASCRLMVKIPLEQNVEQADGLSMELNKQDTFSNLKPLDIENINMNISMKDGEVAMDKMAFQIGEGQYDIQGKIGLGQGLEPQLFNLTFRANPAKIDPFLPLVSEDLVSLVSGEITVGGQINGDFRDLRDKPIFDMLKTISGEMLISDEGIKIDAAEHRITNPKRIFASFKDGKLDLASLRLVDKTSAGEGSEPKRTSSIAAFGEWEIGGEKRFDATVDLDMDLVSKLMGQPSGLLRGWLAFKIEARGQEVKCLWPPMGVSQDQGIAFKYAVIDRFEGKVVYRDQGIYVEEIRLSSGENHVVSSGKIPLTGAGMNLKVDARLGDLGILSLIDPEIAESAGKGVASITITGDMKKILAKMEPIQFVGACSFEGLDVNFERAFVNFEDVEADIELNFGKPELNRGSIDLKTFRGKLNGGNFYLNRDQTARSGVSSSVQPGAELVWDSTMGYRLKDLRDMSITMEECSMYQPLMYSVLFDGTLVLTGRFDAPVVRGSISVEEGEYIASLDTLIQTLFSSREIGVKVFLDYPLVQDLELDVSVLVPKNMWMRNSLIDAQAKAAATVRGSLANLRVDARASVIEGKFSYFGREFTITRGEITNEAEINPRYDIEAETEIDNPGGLDINTTTEKLKVQMKLKGSLTEGQPPILTISGGVAQENANMSKRDIIALLTLGTTSDAFLSDPLSAASSPVLMGSAVRYLGAEALERLKLPELQVQVDLDKNKEIRLTVAKQLMDQISVLVGVTPGGFERIGLQYDMTKHVALAGEVDEKGFWDFDLKYILGR